MRGALMKSCNPYFCNLAYDIGTNQLISAARDLGLGAKTGIDFGIDMAGTVPDAQWKSRMYRERWYSGDLLQMSIGQGMLLASPLQMARLAGAIGTGYLVVPRLKADQPCERVRVNFTDAQLAVVREGMRMVVDGGTGRRGGLGVSVPVSGKTGTAEVGRGESRRKNAWFIAYAPSENPMVAVAMVVENGDSGGGTAAPKVCEILKEVFNDR
jgi:penicillin-binding protein 2